MRNQLKIGAVVVAVIVGMVLYKEYYDRKKGSEKTNPSKGKDLSIN